GTQAGQVFQAWLCGDLSAIYHRLSAVSYRLSPVSHDFGSVGRSLRRLWWTSAAYLPCVTVQAGKAEKHLRRCHLGQTSSRCNPKLGRAEGLMAGGVEERSF